MNRGILVIILSLFVLYSTVAIATQNRPCNASEKAISPAGKVGTQRHFPAKEVANTPEFHASVSQQNNKQNTESIILLFFQSLFLGVLAVFTPYVYTIHPFTVGYLSRNTKSAAQKLLNALLYAASLVVVFTLLGILISFLIKVTGVRKFTEHWIFNLFFFRIFLTLGISFLGAFAIKLPAAWINSMAKKAETNNFKGIFIMAVTLPGASFSSTFPIVGLVLLLAGGVNIIGPVIGLFGFSIGLSLPFVFPVILDVFVKSKSMLNNIKVILGFSSLMVALKFLSKADISLGLNLIDRDVYIVIWMGIWLFLGIYMLGLIKLSHDTETEHNIYGQEYIPLPRLFIAIASFVFALYLLPGIWGAPLHGINNLLPQ